MFSHAGPKVLRPDQVAAITAMRGAVGQGVRRLVMQAPTGSGKTVIGADMVQRARAKSKRVLITVPAISLVDQTVEALAVQGIRDVGVIQAQHFMTDGSQPVQVASVQTLIHRNIPESDLVLIDECHKWFKFYEQWFRDIAWQNIPIIGLSATPWTKGLGAYYDKLIIANTIGEMIRDGLLAPFRVFAPTHPDLTDVRIVAGDYHEGDLFEAMKPKKLVADIVESWKKLGDDRPTVCFAVNRAHANQIATEFNAAGIPAGYMDCETPLLERSNIRTNLKSRNIKVVCNVDVIGLGVDWPEVSCIIYARPTRSEMRYVQNIGRGLRIAEGKTDLVVIDHSDTTLRLGFVSDIHHDELNDGKPKLTAEKVIQLPKECPQCHYLKPPRTAVCPSCGYEAVFQATEIKTEDGELRELTKADMHKPAPVAAKMPIKAKTYGQLLWYSRSKNYKDGWASNKYREIYGVWPRSLDWQQYFTAPEMVLASWIKAQHIRRAKSMEKEQKTRAEWKEAVDAVRDEQPKMVPGTLMTEEDLKYF